MLSTHSSHLFIPSFDSLNNLVLTYTQLIVSGPVYPYSILTLFLDYILYLSFPRLLFIFLCKGACLIFLLLLLFLLEFFLGLDSPRAGVMGMEW